MPISCAASMTAVSNARARSRRASSTSSPARSPDDISRVISAPAAEAAEASSPSTSWEWLSSARTQPGASSCSTPSSPSRADSSRASAASDTRSPTAPTARRTSPSASSWDSASVTESTNSWASSSTTASRSGSTCTPVKTSSASRVWLATTTSASFAASRACSEKQSTRSGHRAPRHSRALTDTCLQARSVTGNGTSSRSPLAVCSAHSRSRTTCVPSEDCGASNRLSTGSSSRAPGPPCTCCRQT